MAFGFAPKSSNKTSKFWRNFYQGEHIKYLLSEIKIDLIKYDANIDPKSVVTLIEWVVARIPVRSWLRKKKVLGIFDEDRPK